MLRHVRHITLAVVPGLHSGPQTIQRHRKNPLTVVVESVMVSPVQLIGTAEAAQVIGVERSTLSHWIAKGRITPAQKLPGKTGVLLFTRNEVERVRDEYASTLVASSPTTGERSE